MMKRQLPKLKRASILGGHFWTALALVADPGLAQRPAAAQSTIDVQLPASYTANWVVNATTYGNQTSAIIEGTFYNTASFSAVSEPGNYFIGIGSSPVIPANTGLPQPTPTSLTVSLANGTANPTVNTLYQVIALGGDSVRPSSTQTGEYANSGANLFITASGVSSFVDVPYAVTGTDSVSTGFALISEGGGGTDIPSSNDGNYQALYSTYGAPGGAITASLSNLSITLTGQPVAGATLPWLIPTSGMAAASIAGGALAFSTPNKESFNYFPGNGSDGGDVQLTIGPNVAITLGNSQDPLNTSATAPAVGILASSLGSAGAVCCVSANYGYDGYPVTLTSTTPTTYTVSSLAYGSNGNGGAVNLSFSGAITGNAPNLYGIAASSVGASTQYAPNFVVASPGQAPPSGAGGPVTVNLSGGTINLTEASSVGIFAASLSDQVILPSQVPVSGSGNTAGAVSVSLDAASAVSVGESSTAGSGQMSAGVIAVSSTGWLFQPVGNFVQNSLPGAASAGNGGNITITNAGSIQATGDSAFGVVALSLGNGGLLSNAPSSVNGTNYAGGSQSAASQSNSGGAVTVTNSGTIATTGNAAIGILAASNGSGGLLAGIPDALFANSSLNEQNIAIGTQPSGIVAGASASTFTAQAGDVTVTNSGTIQTSGGVAAIGVLAQAVGGGGASLTEGVALFAGDAGGAGGTGGSITLNNSGLISTAGDGSIGFLAQSVGGGGGHGANSKGLFVAVGGQGGSGGDGGAINTTFEPGSAFQTSGDFASGMVLQSIGGGGGNGGFGKAYGLFFSTGIGGAGGSGGQGGTITVNGSGTLGSQSSPANALTTGDHSHGLMLQSIGGGGGTGGHAYSFSPGAVFAGAVAVGGSGSTGGLGGDLNICPSGGSACSALAGSIATNGTDSIGLVLQTIGGGGGYGGGALGDAFALNPDPEIPTVSLSASVGGSAAGGGAGGSINVASGLGIATQGTGSHAIFAQSVGGGGGMGGDSTAGANSINTSETAFTGSVSLGGTGGPGGGGGAIALSTTGNALSTLGHNASAIFAQSVGGGGGYGAVGNAYQNDVADGDKQIGLAFALGGSGNGGGGGGSVSLINGAGINTTGSQSSGVVAQSIGGGGGSAGNAGAQGVGSNIALNLVIGGNAGSGSDGGTVSVTNNAAITTGLQLDLASDQFNAATITEPIAIGGDSHGIVAQSVGGGGGIGGNADPTAALLSSVQKLLDQGAGTYINNVGANDYFGDDNDDDSSTNTYTASIAVGGAGGGGGDGGDVSVTNTGNITTFGHRSYGILAQSVGGGGGNGGTSTASSTFFTASVADSSSGLNVNLGINVGGSSGSGGDGGSVSINSPVASIYSQYLPIIQTTGYASHAIVAQSVGGGGGIAHDGSLFNASGSIGKGNANVTLGSFSGSAGNDGQGGSITLGNSATISSPGTGSLVVTMGDDAAGYLLQSVGGGGGIASFGCTNSGNAGLSPGATTVTSSACLHNANTTPISGAQANTYTPAAFQGLPGLQPAVSLSAATGSGLGSQGGSINYYANVGQIVTQGNRSFGFVAQSLGGGGGFLSAPSQSISSASLPTGAINQSPGGDISILIEGRGQIPIISTSGDGAWGLLAQSVGGGGGFVGDPAFSLNTVPQANSAAADQQLPGGADGGNIYINLQSANSSNTQAPQLNTTGSFAHGIVAQSIGGGGGIANGGNGTSPVVGSTAGATPSSIGQGGQIFIYLGADVNVGPQSAGIFAQSSGNSATTSPITIDVAPTGSITTTASTNPQTGVVSTGPGIVISGGSNDASNPNVVQIQGSVTSNTAAENTSAIFANYGYTNVTIYQGGLVSGSVDLGSTPGDLNNYGTFNAGPIVIVGNNSLHNYGLMRIGELRTVSRTDMKGRFVQHSKGRLEVTVDSLAEAKADYVAVKGRADLGGTVYPRTKSLLSGPVKILAADDLDLTADINDSLVFDWQLKQIGNKVLMSPVADFKLPTGQLTRTQRSLASYLQRSWDQGDSGKAELFGLIHEFSASDVKGYRSALDQISAAALNSQPIQMQTTFAKTLSDSLACPTLTPDGLKPNRDTCVWAEATGDYTTQSGNADNAGYWLTAPGIRLGGQRSLGKDWFAGIAFGYGTNYLRSTDFSSNGDFFTVAASLRKDLGAFELGASLAFAQGWYENSRSTNLSSQQIASNYVDDYSSNSSSSVLGMRLRAAYNYKKKNLQVKPYLDLDFNKLWMPAFQESGGPLAIESRSSSHSSLAISPMLELGLYSSEKGNNAFKLYASFGASFLPDNSIVTPMALRRDQADFGTYNVSTKGPSVLGRLNIGAQAAISNQLEIRAQYNLEAGSGYRNQGLSANLVYRF